MLHPKSSKYSLGWISFRARAFQYKAGQIVFAGQRLGLWVSHGLVAHGLRSGKFSENSRGRWCLDVVMQMPELTGLRLPVSPASTGIDLGLKDVATTSTAPRSAVSAGTRCTSSTRSMAKSTLDARWAMPRAMLEYKSQQAGIVLEVVNESYATQIGSSCGSLPASSPKGMAVSQQQAPPLSGGEDVTPCRTPALRP